MKPLYLLVVAAVALAGPNSASAQDTSFFDFRGTLVDPQHADFFETKVQTDSGWTFADHWMNGKLKIKYSFRKRIIPTVPAVGSGFSTRTCVIRTKRSMALYGGTPNETYKNQPIVFKLENVR
jgi:hypothetical protein